MEMSMIVVLDATEQATIAELKKELSVQGFAGDNLFVDGEEPDESSTLDASPLRHGARIAVVDRPTGGGADAPARAGLVSGCRRGPGHWRVGQHHCRGSLDRPESVQLACGPRLDPVGQALQGASR